MDKKQLLFTADCLHIRESEGETPQESRTIEGRAIVFNQEATLYEDKYERYSEVILPSCITQDFLREQDIKLNLLHERESSVARNNKGAGTLVLELKEDGLYFSAEMPKCDLGDRALELVRNGTYTGCSVEFYQKAYDQEKTTDSNGRECVTIVHKEMAAITALTIAMDPVYSETTIALREQAQHRAEEREHTPEHTPTNNTKTQNANTIRTLREIVEEGDALL